MQEGTLVVVTGKIDTRIKDQEENLIIGTFIGYVSDKRVVILLPEGYLFIGEEYEISPYEEQV